MAEAAAARDAIRAALATMPEVERTVILMAYRDELTQQEIAGRLGWPLGTVKTRTRRALARLRGLLEPDGVDIGVHDPGREDAHGSR
jgi:RNA polymerase sigma-70 factor (ECF subfamily)